MSRVFCLGDLHSRYEALIEVLTLSRFDKEKDTLILLGDIADGGGDCRKSIDLLLTLKNIILIRSNHDQWLVDYCNTGDQPKIWISQGGAATLFSYGGKPSDSDDPEYTLWIGAEVPRTHKLFLNSGVYFHEQDDMLFVHGGMDPLVPIEMQDTTKLLWDRYLALNVMQGKGYIYEKYPAVSKYKHIFLGHTAVKEPWLPVTSGNITCLDTGAGYFGKLTIMDIHTREFWQSSNTGDVWRWSQHEVNNEM